jgi:kojibiose phosphorylase
MQAVIFDMDGVLCDTVEYQALSWKRVADEFGIPFKDEYTDQLRGLTRQRSLELLLGDIHPSEQQIQAMLDSKNKFYLELIMTMTPADLLPGVERLLKELQKASLKLAIASSSILARTVLQRLEISDYFQVIVDGRDVQKSKPAPTSFLCAAKSLSVKPSSCVVIEDAEAGVQAGLAAGMCVIGLGPPERVGKAHAVFEDLSSMHIDDLNSVYSRWKDAIGS